MASDRMAHRSNGWMMMLADIIALMLAFFVLAFSMREMTSSDSRPEGRPANRPVGMAIAPIPGTPIAEGTVPAPLARAPVDGHAIDQLQAPEHQAAGPPALAYLAAVLRQGGGGWVPEGIFHDETMLTVALPQGDGPRGDGLRAEAVVSGLRPLLLPLAHLASRFDLDLAIDMPHSGVGGLDAQVARAVRLRIGLAGANITTPPEITFGAVRAASIGAAAADRARAALIVRPAASSAGPASRP
jgi:hypothetical protein